MLKPKLCNLIRKLKETSIKCALDSILRKESYDIFRLLSYYQDLNPIKMIWVEIKQFIAKQNIIVV